MFLKLVPRGIFMYVDFRLFFCIESSDDSQLQLPRTTSLDSGFDIISFKHIEKNFSKLAD